MSGFEIAGAVLAAVPLVIAALNLYADGIQTAKHFMRYEHELSSLGICIETSGTILKNTLEQLLGGIVEMEHMYEFLSNPGGEAWQDATIDERLRKRLGESYNVYFNNVAGMQCSMIEIKKKLGLDANGKPQYSDPCHFTESYRRLKFSLNRSAYSEELDRLNMHNQALGTLTMQSLNLEPSRSALKTLACPNFNAIRSYACSLFDTLLSSLKCSCDTHAVKLRLESRNEKTADENDLLANTYFRVIFTHSLSLTLPSVSPWKEADIRWITDKTIRLPPSPQVTPHKIGKAARQVHFDKPQTQASSSTITITKTSMDTSSSNLEITDLCKAIEGLHLGQSQANACAGYLVDKLQRKQGIYPCEPPAPPNNQEQWTAYTLRQVLSKQAGVGRQLARADTYKIALHLASSVLQLYQTPWLSNDWSDVDVYFVLRPGTSLASVYQHPFIYRDLSTVAGQGSPPQQPANKIIRSQTLFSLGVVLIELLYRRSIEELQTPEDLQCGGTPGVIWCTADRLITTEQIELEGGNDYANAVRRSIRCDFDFANWKLEDRDFQKAVYSGVVAPLEVAHRHFTGQFAIA